MTFFVQYNPANIRVQTSSRALNVATGSPIVKEYVDVEPYNGPYSVTPTQETQILNTSNKRMLGNVIVNPIPSFYGRIGWNGNVLTVS